MFRLRLILAGCDPLCIPLCLGKGLGEFPLPFLLIST
jgi:hypothetical protein